LDSVYLSGRPGTYEVKNDQSLSGRFFRSDSDISGGGITGEAVSQNYEK
jgi:hypothetical protein